MGPVARGFAAQAGDSYEPVGSRRSDKLDVALFDVNYLVDEGYHQREALPVIVEAKDRSDAAALAVMVDSMGGAVARTFNHLPLIAVELPYGAIGYLSRALEDHPYTEKVWLDRIVRPSLDSSVPLIGAPTVWALGYRGEGIEIAILDTGIDATHPDLDDLDDLATTTDPKVVRAVNFTDDPNADDISSSGHGTHVAGTAAGTGEASGGSRTGVAPQAFLWNLKVLGGAGGSGQDSWIIAAIEYAAEGPDATLNTGDEADVINMSLGDGINGDGTDPMSQAVDLAVSQGVVVAIAAGNDGPGMATLSQPGVARDAITVGATDDSDTMAGFSSRGPTLDLRLKPDVTAPGVSILSADAGGSGYASLQGTSMATPHVAGAAAPAAPGQPNLGPEDRKGSADGYSPRAGWATPVGPGRRPHKALDRGDDDSGRHRTERQPRDRLHDRPGLVDPDASQPVGQPYTGDALGHDHRHQYRGRHQRRHAWRDYGTGQRHDDSAARSRSHPGQP